MTKMNLRNLVQSQQQPSVPYYIRINGAVMFSGTEILNLLLYCDMSSGRDTDYCM